MVAWTKVAAVEVERRGCLWIYYILKDADRLDMGVKFKDDSKSFDLNELNE